MLPAYTRLVVDEGHHLEDAAARAPRRDGDARAGSQRLFSGSTVAARDCCRRSVAPSDGRSDLLSTASLDLVEARLAPSGARAREKSALLFDLLDTLLERVGQPVVRLTDELRDAPDLEGGASRRARRTLLGEIELLGEGLQLVRERMEARARSCDEALAPLLSEMRAVTRRLQAAGDALQRALAPPGGRRQRALDRGARHASGTSPCRRVPLDLAPILREDLFAST